MRRKDLSVVPVERKVAFLGCRHLLSFWRPNTVLPLLSVVSRVESSLCNVESLLKATKNDVNTSSNPNVKGEKRNEETTNAHEGDGVIGTFSVDEEKFFVVARHNSPRIPHDNDLYVGHGWAVRIPQWNISHRLALQTIKGEKRESM